jgi:CspA family cold shock protein
MPRREIGIIKWYDNDEGCGYIARKKGEDVYVHYSAVLCASGDCVLKEGDAVEFTVLQGNNGPQAQDVVILR